MKSRFYLLIVGAALASCSILIHSQTLQSNREQTVFSAEDTGMKNPVPIPKEVLAMVRNDDLVQHGLQSAGIAPENLPASWFSASEIALRRSGEKDLIIAAEGPLVGANLDTFWVLIPREKGYELALKVSVHDLTVKNSRTKGYRNIETMAATAVKVTTASYRFDGREYKLSSEKTEDSR